jgi:hypothetical protein
MVIFRVVGNDNHAATGSEAGAAEFPEETEEGVTLEFVLLAAEYEPAIGSANRSEISHALACRRMQQNRIFDFWWNPHAAPGTVLLKVYFVSGP